MLPWKLLSPEYVAISDLMPGVVEVRLHIPESTVPVQVSVPSLTITLPVGEPLVAGVTPKVTG